MQPEQSSTALVDAALFVLEATPVGHYPAVATQVAYAIHPYDLATRHGRQLAGAKTHHVVARYGLSRADANRLVAAIAEDHATGLDRAS